MKSRPEPSPSTHSLQMYCRGCPPKMEPLQLAPSVGRVSALTGATGGRFKANATQKGGGAKRREDSTTNGKKNSLLFHEKDYKYNNLYY